MLELDFPATILLQECVQLLDTYWDLFLINVSFSHRFLTFYRGIHIVCR